MPTLTTLLLAVADLTATEPRPEAQATAAALRAASGTDFPPQTATALATGIQHSSALSGAHPVAGLILEAQPFLPWSDSPAASLQPTTLRAIKSIVTLLGPDAPIPSPDLLFGFFYQAPGSYYPLHAHNAAETYTILAGRADWQAGDRRFPLTPGEAIHHPPNLPHAMRAGPDGFLAMWRWSGDIGFDSYRMLPDPEA
jgi:mannose-6-phosphate isomerase-like protein (cupin superfamily)